MVEVVVLVVAAAVVEMALVVVVYKLIPTTMNRIWLYVILFT